MTFKLSGWICFFVFFIPSSSSFFFNHDAREEILPFVFWTAVCLAILPSIFTFVPNQAFWWLRSRVTRTKTYPKQDHNAIESALFLLALASAGIFSATLLVCSLIREIDPVRCVHFQDIPCVLEYQCLVSDTSRGVFAFSLGLALFMLFSAWRISDWTIHHKIFHRAIRVMSRRELDEEGQ
jgi:hypothetical protein